MKKAFRAFSMCFTMFTILPCPYSLWDDAARPLMTLFLPVVGAFVGGLWTLAAFAVRLLSLPALIGGAILCAFPFLITGGIHFDGFLDVTDAVKSCRDLEERRRILKDPHVGSFAVLAAALLFIAQFALFSAAKADANLFSLLLIAVVSRAVAALCVSVLRPMQTSEYAGVYRQNIRKSHIAILSGVLICAVALGFVFLGKYGFVSIAVLVGYGLCLLRAFRSLNGMSGDVSGYAMTVAELCGIAVFALI